MRTGIVTIVAISAAIMLARAEAAPTEKVIYAFQGGSGGRTPLGELIADASGALYGTTSGGGSTNCSDGCGVVFKLTPPATSAGKWTETVLYAFTGGTDGGLPQASLIADATGALYGTTATGGSMNCSGGCGTVFKLTPPSGTRKRWTETVLHAFTGGTDGHSPLSSLIMDSTGALYGTTSYFPWFANCLTFACGTVFKLTPPAAGKQAWTETVLHKFADGSDGTLPVEGVIMDTHGALYGTTSLGGSSNCYNFGCGTAFKLSPPKPGSTAWTENILHAFTGGPALGGSNDGASVVAGLTADAHGALFGTTFYGIGTSSFIGDGTVYKLTPPKTSTAPWTESVLYAFQGGTDGYGPTTARLLVTTRDVIYGTTSTGGHASGCGSCGIVYQLTPPGTSGGQWNETVLHTFQGGSDGDAPQAGLISVGGALYGTTSAGGGSSACLPGCGTVYMLKP